MTNATVVSEKWPYPTWIAHRGAGTLAPENTMAAFRLGAHYGYRMFECDVKLSADHTPFLLHDSTLSRTTNHTTLWGETSQTTAGVHAWDALATLDAGSWHSAAFAGEPLATLKAVALWCLRHQLMLNIEIKPTPGTGKETGQIVANEAATLWQGQAVQPLLTSFDIDALDSAKKAQPHLPRGLLLDSMPTDWLDTALDLDCVAVVCKHELWNQDHMTALKRAGLKALAYTVNTQQQVQRLLDLGIDGMITDRVDRFTPEASATPHPHQG